MNLITRIGVLLLFICFSKTSLAQKSLVFIPMYGTNTLQLDSGYYKLNINDSIQFNALRFYISGIELNDGGKLAWKESNSYHLLDASDFESMSVYIDVAKNLSFNEVKFNIGIDSVTNCSGAMPGDLDPTKGMYWTWQNGYINFKLEGKSNLCKTRKNEFQFHLGGYRFPFSTLQAISVAAGKEDLIYVYFDMQKLISSVDLSNENQVMSPCREAVALSEKLSVLFKETGQ